MKKIYLMMAVAALAAQSVSAQPLEESKTLDNWYVGINAGVDFKTTHTAVFKNLNPSFGVRVGRNFTQVFGLAVEGEAFFDNKGSEFRPLGTFVKLTNVSLLGATNFSNWFGGYKGTPRAFEISAIYGLGWGHAYHTASNSIPTNDSFTGKVGIDFAFNLGSAKAWQLYVGTTSHTFSQLAKARYRQTSTTQLSAFS